MLITAKMNRDFGACYSDDKLRKLYGNGKTPKQVATLRDGLWADVSTADRCWILWRVLAIKNPAGMRECLARMVERVLPANCDPRSRAVVQAIRNDAVTDEIIAAAYAAWREVEAASSADATDAAYAAYAAAAADATYAASSAHAADAADTAWRVAYAASAAYAWAHAWADAEDEVSANAERRSQISDILEFCV